MGRYRLHIFTVVCLALVSMIYHFENEVNSLDSEILAKIEYIEKAKNDIAVMEAEWSYQNTPKRLASLNRVVSTNEMTTPTLLHLTNIKNLESKRTYFSQIQNEKYR